MKANLVVTIACPDRPGIVERITEVIESFAANWEESRMARLGGDFAGIVKVSAPREKADELAEVAFRALTDDQMTVAVKVTQPAATDAQPENVLCDLRLAGADHEGIVHEVSGYLAGRGINVESMDTKVVPAPMSASPLFQMEAQIKVPAEVPLSELNANLERIGEELGVDIEVRPCQE